MTEYSSSSAKSYNLNGSFEIRIKDFSLATDKVKTSFLGCKKIDAHKDSHIYGSVSVYPNGTDEDTKGWLVIFSNTKINIRLLPQSIFLLPNNSYFSGTVSVIDNEGNSRFPRSFEELPNDNDSQGKYLERNSILNQAEEFLNEDVLTLRFDIELAWNDFAIYSPENMYSDLEQLSLNDFINLVSSKSSVMKCDGTTPISTTYDLTSPLFESPLFHNRKNSFGIYGRSLASKSIKTIDQFKDNTRIMKGNWVFNTFSDSFYLNLDEDIGARLINSSPVIRKCVKASMKEQLEKRVDFPVDSLTFKIVLYELENEVLPDCSYDEIFKVYEFSHMYMMKELQEKCAGKLVTLRGLKGDEALREISDVYSDDYLSSLLSPNNLGYENLALVSRHSSEKHHFVSDWSGASIVWL